MSGSLKPWNTPIYSSCPDERIDVYWTKKSGPERLNARSRSQRKRTRDLLPATGSLQRTDPSVAV